MAIPFVAAAAVGFGLYGAYKAVKNKRDEENLRRAYLSCQNEDSESDVSADKSLPDFEVPAFLSK